MRFAVLLLAICILFGGYENRSGVSETNPPESDVANAVSPESVGREVAGFDQGELAGDRATLTVDGVEFAFRYCPAGEFLMGSPESEKGRWNAETQHEVTLTRGFWLMETELTQKQWKALMGENPSRFKGDDLPVENISWNDCQELIEKLNAHSSKPSGWRFDLPTEAQWEYACRAGTTEARYGNLDDVAWYLANSGKTTHPVGKKTANAWGLYDMLGNVWEWCKDWYDEDYYKGGAMTDPEGPSAGLIRVVRGGGWSFNAENCRSASRLRFVADGRYDVLGARLALVSTSN